MSEVHQESTDFNGGSDMEQHDDIESEVLEFVAREVGLRRDRLSFNTTLLGELGLDGDDADDFFEAFSETFHVDLSTLNLSKHFGAEGYLPWQIPLLFWRAVAELIGRLLSSSRLSRKTAEEQAGLVPITIGELVSAARAGRWRPRLAEVDNRRIREQNTLSVP